MKMELFTAKIANYFGHGNERTDYSNGGWSWNVIHLHLGKYKVRIIQDKEIIANNVEPQGFVYTTDIEVTGVKKYDEGKNVINDLCRLLSLASFSQVVPFSYAFAGNKKTINISAEAMHFRPLIDIKCGNSTKAYVENTWASYRKHKKSRKIAEVIEMLTIAELPVQPLEVKLVQIFVVMENLKGTFAKKNGIPFSKGAFRNVIYSNKSLHKQPTYGFEDLLKTMFKEFGMKPRLRKIVRLRNEIIHFGLSRKPYGSLQNDYDYCHDIIREYLLRLLQYKGEFLIYSKSSREISNL